MYGLDGLRVRKRMIIENSRQNVRLEHQITVQIESLYFRRAFETCCRSGNENTSRGREFPSRGSNDCVDDSETRGGGGTEGHWYCCCWYLDWWDRMSCGGEPSSLEVKGLAEDELEG